MDRQMPKANGERSKLFRTNLVHRQCELLWKSLSERGVKAG